MDLWPHESRSARHPVRLRAELSYRDGSTAAAEIVNTSNDGCCLIGAFTVGDELTVRLPRFGTFAAQVCWAAQNMAGLRFLPPAQPLARHH